MASSSTTAAHKRDASPNIDPSEPAPKSVKVMESTLEVTSAIEPSRSRTGETGEGTSAPTEAKEKSEDTDSSQSSIIKEHVGDLFEAPDNTLLIHACNTQGSWGGGIAAVFRQRYPKAYQVYREYCVRDHDPKTNPVTRGTCLLIPPCETKPDASKHWIGCLFTSAKYGKAKDPPHVILNYTTPAFKDLLVQLSRKTAIQEVRMCQINAGLFAVPWKATKKAVKQVLANNGTLTEVHVYTPANLPTSKAPRNLGNRNLGKAPAKGASSKGTPAPKEQPLKGQPARRSQPGEKRQSTLNFISKS
ncbi:hypothetical protein BU23DRAFT_555393 [Bimuria novae-zelandiae CBS 107.79]|uniref:ADP-ribose 1''-phosphate phosphatase n=1 Tax=Bimuria novae-zelandiae CBS 107.79 TaxID=1447943 RepID=A0A6A5VFU7_9PLEO|nr:hypothetical protein BU23DRAFT_555393 [Bimuria novae-zelandiae CBS 107.79]